MRACAPVMKKKGPDICLSALGFARLGVPLARRLLIDRESSRKFWRDWCSRTAIYEAGVGPAVILRGEQKVLASRVRSL